MKLSISLAAFLGLVILPALAFASPILLVSGLISCAPPAEKPIVIPLNSPGRIDCSYPGGAQASIGAFSSSDFRVWGTIAAAAGESLPGGEVSAELELEWRNTFLVEGEGGGEGTIEGYYRPAWDGLLNCRFEIDGASRNCGQPIPFVFNSPFSLSVFMLGRIAPTSQPRESGGILGLNLDEARVMAGGERVERGLLTVVIESNEISALALAVADEEETTPKSLSNPEPATWAMLGLGLVFLMRQIK